MASPIWSPSDVRTRGRVMVGPLTKECRPRCVPGPAKFSLDSNLRRKQQVGRHCSMPLAAAVNRRHYGGERCPTAV